MTTITRFTKEQLIEQAKGNLIGIKNYVTVYPERAESEAMNIRLAEIALASLEAEAVLYAAEETLAYAKHGELHLTCLSEPMGDAVIPLYTAPPAPVLPDSENGLMPCPFCGGKARQLTIEQDNDPHFGGDVITCTECGASSHVEFGFKENLKSAWNSRAAMLKGNVQ